jgi:hypothetical protein
LKEYEQPRGALQIITFTASNEITIKFYVQGFGDKICALKDVEELSHVNFKQWNSVGYLLEHAVVVGAETVTLKVSLIYDLSFICSCQLREN